MLLFFKIELTSSSALRLQFQMFSWRHIIYYTIYVYIYIYHMCVCVSETTRKPSQTYFKRLPDLSILLFVTTQHLKHQQSGIIQMATKKILQMCY